MRRIHGDKFTRIQTVAVMIAVVITLLLPISANAELSQENIHIIHYGEESNGWIGLHISFLRIHDALMVSLQE